VRAVSVPVTWVAVVSVPAGTPGAIAQTVPAGTRSHLMPRLWPPGELSTRRVPIGLLNLLVQYLGYGHTMEEKRHALYSLYPRILNADTVELQDHVVAAGEVGWISERCGTCGACTQVS